MLNAEHIVQALKRLEGLKTYLAIDQKLIEIQEDEKLTQDPDFWNDSKAAELVMKKIRGKKAWVEGYQSCESNLEDLQVLFDFFKEGESTEAEVDALHKTIVNQIEAMEFKQMLSDEADSLNAVVQITAGAGGTESCDWASMLLRMYVMYAEKALRWVIACRRVVRQSTSGELEPN